MDHIFHIQSNDLQVYFFASKYFIKTGQLCEKYNPVAWFTHALPDHR